MKLIRVTAVFIGLLLAAAGALAQSLTISPATLPVATVNVSYSQTLTASGGSPPYRWFLGEGGALPPGMDFTGGGMIVGTPTQIGTFTFEVGVADAANGFGSQQYTLQVVVPAPIVLSPPTLPSGQVGVPYSQTISASGGTGSFTFAVTAGALPAGLALDPGTGVLSGTPSTAAASTFTITATDSAQNSGGRDYTITVTRPSGTIQVVSGDRQVVAANAAVPVNLVARVVDGGGNPVAGAEVTWAVVQGAGTISSASTASDAQGVVQAAYITGPSPVDNLVRVTASGSGSSFTFTIRNQQAAVVEPARQLIGPQARLAIVAPTAQLNNIRQRLEQLRLLRGPTVTERLRLSVDGRALPPMSAFALAVLDKDGKPQRGGGASADPADAFDRWGAFVNGDVNVGRQSTVDTQTGFKLRSKGITLGGDYRFAGNHVLGAAVGFMKADADLDRSAGSQDADGYSVSLFGTLVPTENGYVDGILNIGRNRYDGERRSASATLASSTRGNQWGLAINAGYALNRAALALTPFARIEHVDAKVNPFTESGNPAEALAIGEQRLKVTTLALGGQISYAVSTAWGVLSPNGRLEFQHLARARGNDVIAQLAADSVSVPAQIQLLAQDKNFGSLALGVSAVFARGISGFASYERQFARDSYRDTRYLLGLRAEF